jgi:hypothetical protein
VRDQDEHRFGNTSRIAGKLRLWTFITKVCFDRAFACAEKTMARRSNTVVVISSSLKRDFAPGLAIFEGVAGKGFGSPDVVLAGDPPMMPWPPARVHGRQL